jgi:hypothetical protein
MSHRLVRFSQPSLTAAAQPEGLAAAPSILPLSLPALVSAPGRDFARQFVSDTRPDATRAALGRSRWVVAPNPGGKMTLSSEQSRAIIDAIATAPSADALGTLRRAVGRAYGPDVRGSFAEVLLDLRAEHLARLDPRRAAVGLLAVGLTMTSQSTTASASKSGRDPRIVGQVVSRDAVSWRSSHASMSG